MDDPLQDEEFRAYAQHFLDDVYPKLEGSAFNVSLAPGHSRGEDEPPDVGDVKFWVELGASIMLDKPILVLAMPGQPLPERLLRVADEVVRGDLMTPEGQEAVAARVAVMAERNRP